MSSPLADPTPFVNTINQLGAESRSLDEGVDKVKRETANLAGTYRKHFDIISDLDTTTGEFKAKWVEILLRTRDVASAIAAWYRRFERVFLSLVWEIETEHDRLDVVTEFKQFLTEPLPSSRFDLRSVAGLKEEFNKIELLLPDESNRVIRILEGATGPDWKDILKKLQEDLVPVRSGCSAIEQAFIQFATRL